MEGIMTTQHDVEARINLTIIGKIGDVVTTIRRLRESFEPNTKFVQASKKQEIF